MNGGAPCEGFSGLLKAYAEAVQDPSLKLSSPTNYAPVIRRAIEIVREEQQYHILLLICDGYCDAEQVSQCEKRNNSLSHTSVVICRHPSRPLRTQGTTHNQNMI